MIISKTGFVRKWYEVNEGYIDIALLKQANVEPSYYAIFELKYITKTQYEAEGEEIVKIKTQEAINQLMKY